MAPIGDLAMAGADISEHHAGAVLSVNLDAVQSNYRLLRERLGDIPSAAVIKADGYGLGAAPVARALANAGCQTFFVFHVEEGVHARQALPDSEIHVLNGLLPGAEDAYREHRLVPVLGSLGEMDAWRDACSGDPLPCDLHVDTGMLRLGLPPDELSRIADDESLTAGLNVAYIISHLASADEPESLQNAQQLAAFREVRKVLPMGRACLCNSSGIFLGADYHFDLARPGVALYGVAPVPGQPNPLSPVIDLKGRIIQLRDAAAGDTIGYGATYRVEQPTRIATVPVGYADGYLRSLSNNACGYIGGAKVPLVGRVSMDLITFDVSGVPEHDCRPGAWIELIGANNSVDDAAAAAGTIGYEILTSLGNRYHRVYSGGEA